MSPVDVPQSAIDAFMEGYRKRQEDIALNLKVAARVEAEAVRTTDGPAGRCYVMPSGGLLVIENQQPVATDILYIQHVMPITRQDAEDFYGFVQAVG